MSGGGRRSRTAESRRRSVEEAIRTMRERLGEPLSLGAIARAGAASPYHFDRIFREVTGMPPFRFLSALRMDAARRLLLTTRFSATSICFEVGYSSVGSFTSQFAASVGMPPRRLRCFAEAGTAAASLGRAGEIDRPPPELDGAGAVAGTVRAPEGFAGAIFVGVFASPLPSGRPEACVLLHEPGPFHAGPLAGGAYHVFAAGVPLPATPGAGLLPDDALRAAAGPLQVPDDAATAGVELELRPRRAIDPPILVSLPVLLSERLEP